jgi:hypothetical protein
MAVSPALKYTLGRLGLFVVVFAALLPVPLNLLVKAMIALIASAGFSYFLLAKWRIAMAEQLAAAAQRRRDEKTRLRAALAGDESAAAAGDRASGAGRSSAADAGQPASAADAGQPASAADAGRPASAADAGRDEK